jgi:DNA-binding transcriptional regulator YiaG
MGALPSGFTLSMRAEWRRAALSASANPTPPRVARLLREAYGAQQTAKLAAQAIGASHRTTEAWVSGRREPSASTLLKAIATCERLEAAAARLVADLRARRDDVRAQRAAAPGARAAETGGVKRP